LLEMTDCVLLFLFLLCLVNEYPWSAAAATAAVVSYFVLFWFGSCVWLVGCTCMGSRQVG
jgi:hypothetical protein